MRTVTRILLTAGLALTCFLTPGEGMASLVEEFDYLAEGEAGVIAAIPGGTGWSAGIPQDVKTDGAYLTFPPALLNASEGTLEFQLVRAEKDNMETLFLLRDNLGEELLGVYLFWSGFYDVGRPAVVFDGRLNGTFYSDFTSPERGTGKVQPTLIHLSRDIAPGESFNLAVSWSEETGRNAVYLDGVEQPALKRGGNQIGQAVSETDSFFVGGWPEGETGAAVMLNSILDRMVVHDTALNPFRPTITYLNHDAFRVAGYSGRLVEGDTVTVTLQSEPGGSATFDLGGRTGLPMTESERSPGSYSGGYTVAYGDEDEEAVVTGRFVSARGLAAPSVTADRTIHLDSAVYLEVNSSNTLVPADQSSRAGITVKAQDANGDPVRDRPLKLTLSTTDEYTGTVGAGSFEDAVGGEIEVDWGGVTDVFGEVAAQYLSGFAAKTVLVSAKDMVAGDVGVGYVRSYIEGSVDIVVKSPSRLAPQLLALQGGLEAFASRDWLTADGRSRSRITARVRDANGDPVKGDNVSFTLLGDNGTLRELQPRTDSRGEAYADYIAGTRVGQVQVEVRDTTSGLSVMVPVELRPDAPAEISMTAARPELEAGDRDGSEITVKVTDANGNPNTGTDVVFVITAGEGSLLQGSAVTDEEGVARTTFLPGEYTGVVTVGATVSSRAPGEEELSAAEGAVFLYGLEEDPGRLTVLEWLREAEDELLTGDELVRLEDRDGVVYTVLSPRDGILAVRQAEERDQVQVGDTLGYVLEDEE